MMLIEYGLTSCFIFWYFGGGAKRFFGFYRGRFSPPFYFQGMRF